MTPSPNTVRPMTKKWFKLTDSKPSHLQSIIAFSTDHGVVLTQWKNTVYATTISHWMPIPKYWKITACDETMPKNCVLLEDVIPPPSRTDND